MINTDTTDDRYASQYIDLVSERVGGRAIACSDEWFAECDNLVKPGRGVFKQGHFVATGQWMDGWESRRSYGRRERVASGDNFDWCILRMGIAGVIKGFDIDTNHFKGNAPDFVSVEAANISGEVDNDTEWTEILSLSPTTPHSQHLFECSSDAVWTHLRLKMYPDGGIARFRAYGIGRIVRDNFIAGELVDLASVMNGGRGIAASDMFFSSPSNLVMPGRGINMGDGWETKRRRGQGNDWAIVELGLTGTIRKILVDTAYFKGNYPDHMTLEAVNTDRSDLTADDIAWKTVIAKTDLYSDKEHLFIKEIKVPSDEEFTHVRINIFPDGGVSRLRIFGFPNWEAQE
ncbi:allantoicase [Dasania marina]|uniref:allantoicase n=1 Tax=Dasania marina TaxID=471499 RepID=UPI0030DC81E4|tara:strand:- start:11165 stop:12202 length:1038 start_codon:yes stop_codon:yes gene_type:complete